ncbi:MAG: type II 3-dehydroquinate dehydratase [Pseudomonadota bacterium]
MTRQIFLINGPNLNLLGKREPHIYGHDTLADVEARCRAVADEEGVAIDCRQSNYEGDLVSWIQEAREAADAIIMNAGAYTHTSVAIHDALKAYEGISVELHVSNPHLREGFRHHSYIGLAVTAVVAGFGVASYPHATRLVARMIKEAR